ncbi:MAG: GCN5-related N-acetyltransferase [Actinomycetia bacterium]|nr:GCN5-related N-acetyltransferase [Actinomycetes bacterium]
MAAEQFQVRRATTEHQTTVTALIDDAADWLRRDKDTSQWNRPWPSHEGRRKRIWGGLIDGHTWIVWDGVKPAASVTIEMTGNPHLWTADERETPAVYLHRLVVGRNYTGIGLGAELLNWAGKRGHSEDATVQQIRIDVWTDNDDLHRYYQAQGFTFVDDRETPDRCPSGSLFQKPITEALQAEAARLVTEPAAPQSRALVVMAPRILATA